MNLKQTKSTKVEKNLKRGTETLYDLFIKVMSNLSKENLQKYDDELEGFEAEYQKLEKVVSDNKKKLADDKLELAKIKETVLLGIDYQTLEELNGKLDKFIEDQQKGQQKITFNLMIANKVKEAAQSVEEAEKKLTKASETIKELEIKISDLIEKRESAKQTFTNNANALIERLCTYGNFNTESLKAKLAGSKIQLKGEFKDHQCTNTLSLSDLRRVNAIIMLLEVKAELEKASNVKSAEIEEDENILSNCYDTIENCSLDQHDLIIAMNEAKDEIRKTMKYVVKDNIAKAFINMIYRKEVKDSEREDIAEDEDYEREYITENKDSERKYIAEAISDIARDSNLRLYVASCDYTSQKESLKETVSEIKVNKREASQLTHSLKQMKHDFAKLRNSLNSNDRLIINKIQTILNNSEIDINTGLAMINEILDKTAFEAKMPQIEYTKTK